MHRIERSLIFLVLIFCSAGTFAQTALSLDVSKTKTTMTGRGAGFCNSFITDRPGMIPNLSKTKPATLRFPMGGLAKNYLFHNFDKDYSDLDLGLRPRACSKTSEITNSNDINYTTLEFNPELLDFDEFMDMSNSVGAEPVIMLSALGDLMDGSTVTKEQLMRNAIEWVKYSVQKGYNIKYWEFGNEVNLNMYADWIDVAEYESRYLYLQDTLKKIDPDLKLGVGLAGYQNDTWLNQILSSPQFASSIDFLITHQYNVSDVLDYDSWRKNTEDIINPSYLNTKDDIRDIKRAIKLLDNYSGTYGYLDSLELLITEHSTHNAGSGVSQWYDGGQHIVQSIFGFQQIINMFLYDQRVKYSHFWVTSSPFGDRSTYSGDAEAFDMNNNWEITPQGMAVMIFNNFTRENLLQPVVNGDIGIYASSSADGQQLTLFIINKDDTLRNIDVTLTNYTGPEDNVKWIYSGTGPYDKNPVLRKFGSVQVTGNQLSTGLEPVSLTIVQLGVIPEAGTVPSAPPAINAETNERSLFPFIGVSFDSVSNADFYVLERKEGTGEYATVALLNNNEIYYKDMSVISGNTYMYRVKAGNTHGYSAYSSVTEGKTTGSLVRLLNQQGENLVLDGTDGIRKVSNVKLAEGQEWLLQSAGDNFFSLKNNFNNLYLSTDQSTGALTLSDYAETDNLLWSFELTGDNLYYIRHKVSGRYLAGDGTTSGSEVILEDFTGWEKQKWQLIFADTTADSSYVSNGDFELDGKLVPPPMWSQVIGNAYAQVRVGTWFSLVPNGEKAFGARILGQNDDPFTTMLSQDLYLKNKTGYELRFLLKSNTEASVSVQMNWKSGISILADTVISAVNSGEWTLHVIPVIIDQNPSVPYSFVSLKFGFGNNPPESYIMLDDVLIKEVSAEPEASLISDISEGIFPLEVTFSDNSMFNPTSWLWHFGDGDSSTLKNPVHVYESEGSYDVTLRVSNEKGADDTTCVNYIRVINPADLPLTGVVTISGDPVYGGSLTAGVSNSNNTGTLNYQWQRNGSNIAGATNNLYNITESDIGDTINIIITSDIQYGALSSDEGLVIKKAEQLKPAPPVLDSKTDSSISLAGSFGLEYSIDNGLSWQENVQFENLLSSTLYSFVQRYKEIPTHYASPASEVLNVATDARIYTVTFLDWDNTVLSIVEVEEGGDAAAPPEPAREGYIFTGWSGGFAGVSGDLEIMALYEKNTTAVVPAEESGFLFYPNPASDILYVKTSMPDSRIRILSLDGRLLREMVVGSGVAGADVSGLKNDLYILQVITTENIFIAKIVINH